MKLLSATDIREQSGVDDLGKLVSLEILFTAFDEIDSLKDCTTLRHISFIDNNIQRISNLQSVGNTLTSLCLCGQNISKIENLHLPNLKELYLHRNKITKIEGLQHCARLRKLWLFQNQIKEIGDGLYAVPELEILWLQENQIRSLNGLENNLQLTNLGLAGNPITNYQELLKLLPLKKLVDFSLNDIHFPKSTLLIEEEAAHQRIATMDNATPSLGSYKDFICLHLKQIQALDGIYLTDTTKHAATDVYSSILAHYNSSVQLLETNYNKEISLLLSTQQKQDAFLTVFERETQENLSEMDALVQECQQVIRNQVRRQEQLLENNYQALQKRVETLVSQAKQQLVTNIQSVEQTLQVKKAMYAQLQLVLSAQVSLANACGAYAKAQAKGVLLQLPYQQLEEYSVEYGFFDEIVKTAPAIGLFQVIRIQSGALVDSVSLTSGASYYLSLTVAECLGLLQSGWKSLAKHESLMFVSDVKILQSQKKSPTKQSELEMMVIVVCQLDSLVGSPLRRSELVLGVDQCASQVNVEALLLCSQPGLEGGLRGLRKQIDAATSLSDKRSQQNSIGILAGFQKSVDEEVENYIDQLLQEVTAEKADILKFSHADITTRDAGLRAVRGEVEKERRVQDSALRALKK